MKQVRLLLLLMIIAPLLEWFLIVETHAQDIGDLKQLCKNASLADREMAKQAGYDLDEVCGEIVALSPSTTVAQSPKLIARGTVSSTSNISEVVAPVAVAGVNVSTIASDLKPFGYDLFANAPTTYAPASSIPVSGDYLLGPGDTLDILFYGKI